MNKYKDSDAPIAIGYKFYDFLNKYGAPIEHLGKILERDLISNARFSNYLIKLTF